MMLPFHLYMLEPNYQPLRQHLIPTSTTPTSTIASRYHAAMIALYGITFVPMAMGINNGSSKTFGASLCNIVCSTMCKISNKPCPLIHSLCARSWSCIHVHQLLTILDRSSNILCHVQVCYDLQLNSMQQGVLIGTCGEAEHKAVLLHAVPDNCMLCWELYNLHGCR